MEFVPPNVEEISVIKRLKEQISQDHPEEASKLTDTLYLRFYRGRKHDEEKAHKAIVRYLQWRMDNDVDNIAEKISEFQAEFDAGKIKPFGVDKQGHPVVYIYAKRHNKNTRSLEQLQQLIIYSLESVLQRADPANERMLIAFDLDGFNLSCMDYDAVKLLVNILGFNYPETLQKAVIINAPFIFSACWAVIKLWLDPVTAAKVKFIYKVEELKEFLPSESIPSDL